MRALSLALLLAASLPVAPAIAQDYRARLPEDEIIYFLLPDRFENGDTANDSGGLKGDRLVTGFDPASKAFFEGGDLKGLISRLDYIKGLGTTAIWLGPIYKNKPVQGARGQESAGYHGYWITDFTQVDPHFGTNADMTAFVEAAHKRGMKVYLDIIVNHTADVIQYKECPTGSCPYRSKGDYPYSRQGGVAGAPINQGFAGDSVRTAENFAKLTNPNFAYTPYVPPREHKAKVPAWLNDPIYYHNRGDSTFEGESATYGDFSGLDDLMTENPRVLSGFIDIFGGWIDRFKVDGFRIDTARHVNPEFWAGFVPAMMERAKANGIPNFHIFGEVYNAQVEPGTLALHTRVDHLPAVLDFAFFAAAQKAIAGNGGTDVLAKLYAGDALYEGGAPAAMRLPTFLGNHDAGRFAMFVKKERPGISDTELLRRVRLANALMFLGRGTPTVYYGDEQGFVGTGGDQDARESLFASKVASYNAEHLIGTSATTAQSNFNPDHPLYKEIATLAAIREAYPALRRGATIVRASSGTPGLFAFSRKGPDGGEILVAINTSSEPLTASIETDYASLGWHAIAGACPARSQAPASLTLNIPPLDYIVCASGKAAEKQ